jgi:hypothetical protein
VRRAPTRADRCIDTGEVEEVLKWFARGHGPRGSWQTPQVWLERANLIRRRLSVRFRQQVWQLPEHVAEVGKWIETMPCATGDEAECTAAAQPPRALAQNSGVLCPSGN